MNFIIYNFFFYIIYYCIDFFFLKLNLVHKEFDINDINFIILNIFLSSVILFILKRKYVEWENT
jgi:hypothetical protein